MPELQCETVDDHYILRDGAAGLFLAASKFPKNRETRAPLVTEILPHKDEIDPKHSYLFDAPIADDDGNPTIIRYARKTKEVYVQTEIDKKATGWKAFFNNGKWDITKPDAKAPKKAAKKAVKKVAKKKVAKKVAKKNVAKKKAT